nr:hypothetical protein [Candidatus Enterovibrio luxaltus]
MIKALNNLTGLGIPKTKTSFNSESYWDLVFGLELRNKAISIASL